MRDLDLANVRVEGASGMVVGGLAGEMFGTATDVSSSGIVLVANSGAQAQLASAGGLFGALPGTASDVSSSAEVAGGGAAFVGGVAGAMGPGASLTNSSASGEVLVLSPGADQAALAGGLVGVVYGFQIGGVNPTPATLAGDYATGDVLGGGGSFVGGLAGEIIEANVTTSYATGAVTQIAGGVAGVQEDIAGGFVGYVGPGVSITQSYASGAVATVAGPASDTARTTLAGGFSGDIDQGSTISDAYALGSVTSTGAGTSAIGGFSGLVINSASIADSYATGQVSAAAGVAKGFVGLLASSAPGAAAATIADDYWDEGTTGQTSGYLLAGGTATNVIGIGGSTGLSPYAASTYANFNLASTWYLINGETRPILRSEYSTDITNAHQLELMGLDLAANYTLGADFSAAETTDAAGVWNPANGFVPVGPNIPNGFTGSLDGAGHTISGLTIVDNTPVNQLDAAGVPTNGWAGLFGFVSQGGVVENLTIANASVTAGDGIYAGVLAGGMLGSVINTSTSGTVTVGSATNTALGVAELARGWAGRRLRRYHRQLELVGHRFGRRRPCRGPCRRHGRGRRRSGSCDSLSHATGAVSVGGVPAPGSDRPIAGGLVGYLSSQSGAGPVTPTVVANSYATGAVTGGAGSIVGGFVGAVIDSSITTSYATGSVSQTAGGANGEDNVAGGFVGAFQGGTIINESWASGAVNTVGDTGSNFTFAGGFAGDVEQGAVVETDYSLGSVSATGSTSSLLGGFAGIIQTGSSADQVYATGAVTGSGGLGGLVGFMDNTGSLTNGYWDEGTTGVTVAVGSNAGGTVSNVTGIGGSTGLSPYAASTYANFDLANEWYIINGETRPILRAEYSTDITDTHQLELMGLNLGASYTLAGDVNAGDTQSAAGIWNPANGFVPVGSLASPFTGTLNGQGHAVANLTIIDTTAARAASDQYSDVNGTVGLFGTVRGPSAVVENLALTNVAVTGGDGMDVGAVAGALIEGALIDVSSSGVVTAGSGVHPTGGQVGYASAGGLVGEAGPNGTSSPGVRIDSSSSAAKVVGSDAWSGGLVGHTTPGTSIAGSFASGAVVTGATVGVQTAEAGGLVGSDFGATIAGSYATGDASGASGASIGGFAGLVVAAKITTSWASGAASLNGSGGNVGGFAAFVQSGTITQSFSSGAVSATNQAAGSSTNAGGFAGYVDGTISQAYSTGSVTTGGAADQVGGFAGEIDAAGSVDQVYATGRVGTPGTAGGLAGILGGALSNSHWDEGTTSRVNGFNLSGAGAATAVTGMGGTTNVNPFDAATYAGWDFNNTWSTPSAGFYPELFGVSHVIRVTVANSTAVYGGFPVFSYTAFGFQDGDPASIAREVDGLQGGPVGATLSTAGFYNVGVHPVQAFNGSASDPSGTYRIIYVDGQLNVTPRPISASLGGTVEKTYDGTTAADATISNLTLNGALPADQVSLASGFTSAYASKNAGTGVVVTASGLTLTGADASDYSVSGSTSGAVGIIDPKALVASLTGQVVKAADGTTIATLGRQQLCPSERGGQRRLGEPERPDHRRLRQRGRRPGPDRHRHRPRPRGTGRRRLHREQLGASSDRRHPAGCERRPGEYRDDAHRRHHPTAGSHGRPVRRRRRPVGQHRRPSACHAGNGVPLRDLRHAADPVRRQLARHRRGQRRPLVGLGRGRRQERQAMRPVGPIILAAAVTAFALAAPAVAAPASSGGDFALGQNAEKQTCRAVARFDTPKGAHAADIYCGAWESPSGRVTVFADEASAKAALASLCPGASVVLQDAQFSELRQIACDRGDKTDVRRYALVARRGAAVVVGQVFPSDWAPLVNAAAVLSGALKPAAASAGDGGAPGLREIEAVYPAGPPGQSAAVNFELLRRRAYEYNMVWEFGASLRDFEELLSAQAAVAPDDKAGRAEILAEIGLNMSSARRFDDANATLDQAQALAKQAGDALMLTKITNYRAMNQLNQRRFGSALALALSANQARAALLHDAGGQNSISTGDVGLVERRSASFSQRSLLISFSQAQPADKATILTAQGDFIAGVAARSHGPRRRRGRLSASRIGDARAGRLAAGLAGRQHRQRARQPGALHRRLRRGRGRGAVRPGDHAHGRPRHPQRGPPVADAGIGAGGHGPDRRGVGERAHRDRDLRPADRVAGAAGGRRGRAPGAARTPPSSAPATCTSPPSTSSRWRWSGMGRPPEPRRSSPRGWCCGTPATRPAPTRTPSGPIAPPTPAARSSRAIRTRRSTRSPRPTPTCALRRRTWLRPSRRCARARRPISSC